MIEKTMRAIFNSIFFFFHRTWPIWIVLILILFYLSSRS